MIWLLAIPVIIILTFKELIASGFPGLDVHEQRGFLAWCFLIFVGCFISGIISLVPFGISCFIGALPETHGTKDKEFSLITLRERDGIQGQFYFLGAGFIGDRQYYFWYRRMPDGSVSGGKTPRSPGVRIYEDGTDKPRMITFRTEYKNPLWEKYLWIIGLDMRDTSDWYPDFHIPPGSIKEGFSL